jgi:streptogramin lyase
MKSQIVCALAVLGGVGCSAESGSGEDLVGVARASVVMTPPSVRCLTVKVTGSTTVTKDLNVVPEQNSIFDLTGLPVGNDTFTAQAFAVSCSALTGAKATYVSSPITATVGVSPVDITFQMVPASSSSGNADVGFNFNDHGVITEFPLPTSTSKPNSIATGPDGNLWFTETQTIDIARMTPTGNYTAFPSQAFAGEIDGLTAGPDGNLWFTEATRSNVGRITPQGTITEFPMPSLNGLMLNITSGPDGNMWFAVDHKIDRITLAGVITEFTAPDFPYGVTVGSDGNLWFTEPNADKIARMTLAGTVTEFPVPTPAATPTVIVGGPDGNLWFCERIGSKIGRSTPTGVITEFVIPTASARPEGMILGPDGNLWFAEVSGGKIGRITPAGAITEFAISIGQEPVGVAAGPDGNIWFTENSPFGQIGRITP